MELFANQKPRAVSLSCSSLRTWPQQVPQPAVAGSPPTPPGALRREAASHLPSHKKQSSAWDNSKPPTYGP